MKGSEPRTIRMVALFAHRDVERELNILRNALFAAGAPETYSFPPCAPILYPVRPLGRSDLKTMGKEIRGEGSFRLTSPIAFSPPPQLGFAFIGCSVERRSEGEPIQFVIARTKNESEGTAALGRLGPKQNLDLVFRAAYLANLVVRIDDATGTEWSRGEPVWLPGSK